MGLQTPRRFTFSHGLKLLTVYVALWSVLVRPSEGVKLRVSLPGYLSNEDPNEVGTMLNEVRDEFLTSLADGSLYLPGTAAITAYTLPSGMRIIFRVTYWNPETCNLGLGSEALHSITPIPGSYISTIAERLFSYIEGMVLQEIGIGSCTDQGVSVDYFLDLDSDASGLSEDDPDHHEPGEPYIPAVQDNIPSPMKAKRSIGRNALESLGDASLSSRYRSFHKDTKAKDFHALCKTSLVVTNPTSDIFFPTFPMDLDGDCDLPSLILMTGTGPDYDGTGLHSYHRLSQGDKIWSPSTRFVLEMQFDCNLVLYDRVASKPLWATTTFGHGAGCFAVLTMPGDLAVFDYSGTILWSSASACVPNPDTGICWTNSILQVQDDGNLVLYISSNQSPVWSSQTAICKGGCTLD